MERHRRNLKAKASNEQYDASSKCGTGQDTRQGHGLDSAGYLAKLGLTGEAEDQSHPVEHYRRSDGAQQQVFQRGLAGFGVLEKAHQSVERDAGQFQSNIDGDKLGGGGHQHHTQRREEYEGVVFTLEAGHFGGIVLRGQDNQSGNAQEKQLEKEGKAIHGQPIIEDGLVGAAPHGQGETR